jgi:YD repeat-containing protein
MLNESFFGIDGKPSTRDGYSRHEETYDERGNDIESDYFGTDGKPALREGWYARRKWKYDAQGNLLETAYFGLSGEPVNSKIGIWKVVSEYDNVGNRISDVYFDKNNGLTHPFGYSKVRYTYNSIGQQTAILYLDDHDKPVVSKAGWVSEEMKYDNRGYETEESYFDLKHHLVSPPGNTARRVLVLDERANLIDASFYGPDNKLMLNPSVNNVARARNQYDLTGRLTATAYFGSDDKPIICSEGYASSKLGYDERGDIVLWEFFGLKGEPVLLHDGYHKAVFRYDDRDRQIEALYYGLDDKPIASKSNGADKKFTYDARGNLVQVEILGVDGKPLEISGWSKLVVQYSPSDERTEIDKYSKEGRLVGKEH